MSRAATPPPARPVIQIRAAAPGDARLLGRLHVAAWRETYAALLPQEVARLDETRRTEAWARDLDAAAAGRLPAETAILLADGLPAGFVTAGAQRHPALAEMGHDGEVWALYLLRTVQGRGLGRRLLAAGAGVLARRGHWSASVQVLARNLPAVGFYTRMGGRSVARLDAGTRSELTFAWEDAQELLAPETRGRVVLPPLWPGA
ncbi:GNAT family N-acetyltransferase [Frigidibacter sp. MR17.24]|uniref:GNAT family N-acetyltransferase n=1 Tax=Frigidibacter sp. MR17.24 TaxID=3127345 RepID=UPI003012FF3F